MEETKKTDVPVQNQNAHSTTRILPFIIGLIVVVAIVGFYIVGKNDTKMSTAVPTPATSGVSPTEASEADAPIQMQTITHRGLLGEGDNHAGFTLQYLNTWKLETNSIQSDENGKEFAYSLELHKDNAKFTITQGMGNAVGCLYPQNPDTEGMYSRYGEYREFEKEGILWRVARPSDPQSSYIVCEKGEYGFISITSIGWITFQNLDNDATITEEFYAMLNMLTIENTKNITQEKIERTFMFTNNENNIYLLAWNAVPLTVEQETVDNEIARQNRFEYASLYRITDTHEKILVKKDILQVNGNRFELPCAKDLSGMDNSYYRQTMEDYRKICNTMPANHVFITRSEGHTSARAGFIIDPETGSYKEEWEYLENK